MRIFSVLLLSVCCLAAARADGSRYAGGSVLSAGKWMKIKVEQTGIFKISYDHLRKMGFADPSRVSVHGYGGWPLSEDFSPAVPYIDDLPAVAVYKGADYILFYGKGPVKWEYGGSSAQTFFHTSNPYATYGCYFLTDATGGAREMEKVSLLPAQAALNITVFDDYRVHEEELYSVNNSGRELFGESFETAGSKTIPSTSPIARIEGITAHEASVTMRFIARPKSTGGLATLSIDGQELIQANFPAIDNSGNNSYIKAIDRTGTATWEGEKNETPRIVVSYNKSGDENVRLDYIRLHVKRTLRQYGEYTFFRSIQSVGNVSRFVVGNADGNTLVFDITDGQNPTLMETQLSGTELSFAIPAGDLREFVAVQANQSLSGWTGEDNAVDNQNLHACRQTDMVIIAPDAFQAQAERLARRHRSGGKDSLSVLVVSPRQIYNEFSSGTPDATAYRRFMKMFYDRNDDANAKPRYLLLFGDGSYDNRKLTNSWKEVATANMLLTYQSENSLSHYSYVTDDYFGALEDERFTSGPIRLGIGRFPVRTVAEATAAVDKTLNYMDNKETGAWKNRICFVADDGNAADGFTPDHAKQANELADSIITKNHPEFLVNKLFFDAYKKNGNYPAVRSSIQKQLKDGLFLINYTGHGNTRSWSDEDVLNQQDIAGFTYPRLPLWITATCDFTRFDDVSTSAGETVFLSKSGGIALFTTTRVVFSGDNFVLNRRLLAALLERDENGNRPALGDVMRKTKEYTNNNKLNFILIGDPAMKPAYPEYRIKVTAINGKPVTGAPDSLKAMGMATVKGEVTDSRGNPATGFSGTLDVTVFDSKQTIQTVDNNNRGDTLRFTDYPAALYIGNYLVKDGVFEFSFAVTDHISYSNDFGKMNLYAVDESLGIEAQGSYQNFVVGGTAATPVQDNEGPEIRQLYLNDTAFVSGAKVNATPFLVVRLWDATGVNISSSAIGHDIALTIDNPTTIHTLNSYYKLLPETAGEGIIAFSIPALTPGLHTAELRVWDLFSNSTVYTFTFEVDEGIKPLMPDIIAAPSPARVNTQFYIYHNRPESTIRVNVTVYDLAGRLMWQRQEQGASAWGEPYIINWDLSTTAGARLRPGVYIYRAAIGTDSSGEATRAKKLIILAQ
ncbi:MAG: type IX secretion system sortase PorU [Tannerellaceae bacterium]|jgi:hypothetical protein|nr:type IX secretion system sortase PorU [Tannerellaceae bacterium]